MPAGSEPLSRVAEPGRATPFDVEWLGRVGYADALERQTAAVAERVAGRGRDRLLLLEHPSVITLGRSSREENLLLAPDQLAERGIELHRIARGGDVTLHAPGQLVGYLIMDLRARREPDLHLFLRRMEAALITALGELGLAGRRIEGRTGVFMAQAADESPGPDRKISSKWISIL